MPCDSVAVVRARLEADAAAEILNSPEGARYARALAQAADRASSTEAAGGRLAARPPYQPWR